MGKYTSENTHILATHEQAGGNIRMLLHYQGEHKSEFVIGSYFHEIPFSRITFNDEPKSTNGLYEYEWDWGHYFNDFAKAAEYWNDVREGRA